MGNTTGQTAPVNIVDNSQGPNNQNNTSSQADLAVQAPNQSNDNQAVVSSDDARDQGGVIAQEPEGATGVADVGNGKEVPENNSIPGSNQTNGIGNGVATQPQNAEQGQENIPVEAGQGGELQIPPVETTTPDSNQGVPVPPATGVPNQANIIPSTTPVTENATQNIPEQNISAPVEYTAPPTTSAIPPIPPSLEPTSGIQFEGIQHEGQQAGQNSGGLINSGFIVPEGKTGDFIEAIKQKETNAVGVEQPAASLGQEQGAVTPLTVPVSGQAQSPTTAPVGQNMPMATPTPVSVQPTQEHTPSAPVGQQQIPVTGGIQAEVIPQKEKPQAAPPPINPISLAPDQGKASPGQIKSKFEMAESHPLKNLYTTLAKSQMQSDLLIQQEMEAEKRHATLEQLKQEAYGWRVLGIVAVVMMVLSWIISLTFFLLPNLISESNMEKKSMFISVYFVGDLMFLIACSILSLWIKTKLAIKVITWILSGVFVILMAIVALKATGVIKEVPVINDIISLIMF